MDLNNVTWGLKMGVDYSNQILIIVGMTKVLGTRWFDWYAIPLGARMWATWWV